MKTLETQIQINASPEEVWNILLDFQAYAEWNPFIISAKGTAEVGSYMDNIIRQNEKKSMRFQPEVLVINEAREFRWKGKLWVKGLFDGEHYFILQAQNDGSTLLIHGEAFSGLLSGPIMKTISEETQAGFEAMNLALKQRAESARKEQVHAS